MRVTAAFSRLLRLPGTRVRDVAFSDTAVTVTVTLRRRRLACPECAYTTRARYDARPVLSAWRHLDLGAWRLQVQAQLWRLAFPDPRRAHRGRALRPLWFALQPRL